MKKITVLLLLTMPAITGFSQAKLVNAINYLKDYEKDNGKQESLTKAKENIDLYTQGAEIKDPTKAQKVKGQVYFNLFENSLRSQIDKLSTITDANQKSLSAYENTPATDLDVAAESFKAAKAADSKGIYLLEMMPYNTKMINHYFMKANAAYTSKKFDESMQYFEKAYDLDDTKDTNILNNIALTAYNSQNYSKAKETYTKMTETQQGGAETYGNLVETYFMLKDTAGGLEVLKKARAVYPKDGNLLNVETNYYLRKGSSAEALKNLNIAITANPPHAELFLARGNMYEKMAKPEDTKGSRLPKPANYAELFKSAETDYIKSVEISEAAYKANPTEQSKELYFNALYSLGALYFNEGADISRDADKITDNAKFAAENKKANADFNKAMPYLEKSIELKTDQQALFALKQLYSRLEMIDKLKVINEKLKN